MHSVNGQLRMKANVEDPDFGLKIAATQTGAEEIALELRQFGPLVLRFIDTTANPPVARAGFLVSVAEDLGNNVASSDVDVSVKQVRLAPGKLKVLEVEPSAFAWSPEVFLKLAQ
jgi:hypothetical protein